MFIWASIRSRCVWVIDAYIIKPPTGWCGYYSCILMASNSKPSRLQQEGIGEWRRADWGWKLGEDRSVMRNRSLKNCWWLGLMKGSPDWHQRGGILGAGSQWMWANCNSAVRELPCRHWMNGGSAKNGVNIWALLTRCYVWDYSEILHDSYSVYVLI